MSDDRTEIDDLAQRLLDLHSKLKTWKPTFNNLKSLYIKNENNWKKTPIPNAQEIQKEEAWKDMPQEAIDEIKSWPEFDADIFYKITGLK